MLAVRLHPLERDAAELAKEIGYPLLLKASAGGGGRGIKLVWSPAEIEATFRVAAAEARATALQTELTNQQEVVGALQNELDALTVDGTSGGGLVHVTLSAKGELRGLRIDDSLVKPEEKEILEDLIVAAHSDARRKAEALLQEKMKTLTGGLPLPPGLKLF